MNKSEVIDFCYMIINRLNWFFDASIYCGKKIIDKKNIIVTNDENSKKTDHIFQTAKHINEDIKINHFGFDFIVNYNKSTTKDYSNTIADCFLDTIKTRIRRSILDVGFNGKLKDIDESKERMFALIFYNTVNDGPCSVLAQSHNGLSIRCSWIYDYNKRQKFVKYIIEYAFQTFAFVF